MIIQYEATSYKRPSGARTASITVWWKSANVLCHESGTFKWRLLYRYVHTCTTSASGQMSPVGRFTNNSLSVDVLFKMIFCLMHLRGRSFTSCHTRSRWWPRPAGYALEQVLDCGWRNGYVKSILNQIDHYSNFDWGPHPLCFKASFFPTNLLTPWLSSYLPQKGGGRSMREKLNIQLGPRRVVLRPSLLFCSLVRGPWSWWRRHRSIYIIFWYEHDHL